MNNELITKNCDSRVTSNERRGFTLIELVVAVAILAMVILFSGTIFKASIGSYRTASAQAEIMQKLRAITQQLNSDFKGLRKDAPMFIWFQKGINSPDDPNRFDQIMFFADGDFQSTKIWLDKPVVGNVARIYYGQTQNTYQLIEAQYRILARRQHISTADPDLNSWPDPANFASTFTLNLNDYYEYDHISLSQWQALANDQAIVSQTIDVCLGRSGGSRPTVNLADATDMHLLMAQGVGSWSIQWAYLPPPGNKFLWWPSNDIDADGDVDDPNDFSVTSYFGVHFNSPGGDSWPLWSRPGDAIYVNSFLPQFYPSALKFTFTLYDSKGVFKEGQTFTHIVYIGQ